MNDKGSNYTKIDIESVLFLEKSSPYIFDDSGKYNSIFHCSGSGNIDFYFINKTLYSIDKHKIKHITCYYAYFTHCRKRTVSKNFTLSVLVLCVYDKVYHKMELSFVFTSIN